MSTNTTT
ncbi:unnamed protein product [Staurois parvus]|nr:unnamed protein product [Staurois parvus]